MDTPRVHFKPLTKLSFALIPSLVVFVLLIRLIRRWPVCGSQIIRAILFSSRACRDTDHEARMFISPFRCRSGSKALSESQTNPAVLDVLSMSNRFHGVVFSTGLPDYIKAGVEVETGWTQHPHLFLCCTNFDVGDGSTAWSRASRDSAWILRNCAGAGEINLLNQRGSTNTLALDALNMKDTLNQWDPGDNDARKTYPVVKDRIQAWFFQESTPWSHFAVITNHYCVEIVGVYTGIGMIIMVFQRYGRAKQQYSATNGQGRRAIQPSTADERGSDTVMCTTRPNAARTPTTLRLRVHEREKGVVRWIFLGRRARRVWMNTVGVEHDDGNRMGGGAGTRGGWGSAERQRPSEAGLGSHDRENQMSWWKRGELGAERWTQHRVRMGVTAGGGGLANCAKAIRRVYAPNPTVPFRLPLCAGRPSIAGRSRGAVWNRVLDWRWL
ncbi:hypothetical protein B0H14DRAFT_2643393 [Mycena olivaceomarginata]|nr:hypothetical protein B0H14DRAFT_2643393 [Mycena olivaceomarginata]